MFSRKALSYVILNPHWLFDDDDDDDDVDDFLVSYCEISFIITMRN